MAYNRFSFLQPLSADENAELLRQAKSGDDDAKDRFFAHNMRLMMHTTRKFKNLAIPEDDVFSHCQLGFLKAYNTFDFAKNIKFVTYASRCMENEVLHFHVKAKKYARDVSLGATIYVNKQGDEFTVADVLTDTSESEHQAQITEIVELNDILRTYRAKATPRDRKILRLYYGDRKTQREVGKEVGVSQAHITRCLKRAIQSLQEIAVSKGLTEEL